MATITSKGQVTVPAEVRRYMDLREGDRVLFVREAGRVYIDRIPAGTSAAEVYGALRRPGAQPLDVEQARAQARSSRSLRYKPSPSQDAKGKSQQDGC